MKSRLSIDLNEDNQPVIIIKYEHSDYVRDKMVKRFLEDIRKNTEVGFMYLGDNSLAEIKPIKI